MLDVIYVYVVMVFLPAVREEPFGSLVSAAEFESVEHCLEWLPTVVADEFAHIDHAIDGAGCVRVDMAQAIQDAQDRLTP